MNAEHVSSNRQSIKRKKRNTRRRSNSRGSRGSRGSTSKISSASSSSRGSSNSRDSSRRGISPKPDELKPSTAPTPMKQMIFVPRRTIVPMTQHTEQTSVVPNRVPTPTEQTSVVPSTAPTPTKQMSVVPSRATRRSAVMPEPFMLKSYYYPSNDDSNNSIDGTLVIDFNSILSEQLQNMKQKGGATICSMEQLDELGGKAAQKFQLDRTPSETMSAMYECMALSAAIDLSSVTSADLVDARTALANAKTKLDHARSELDRAVVAIGGKKPKPRIYTTASVFFDINRHPFSTASADVIAQKLGCNHSFIQSIIGILTGVNALPPDVAAQAADGSLAAVTAAAVTAAANVVTAATSFDEANADFQMYQAELDAATEYEAMASENLTKAKSYFGRTIVYGGKGYSRTGPVLGLKVYLDAADAVIADVNTAADGNIHRTFESIWLNFNDAITNWIGEHARNKIVTFKWDNKDNQFIIEFNSIPSKPSWKPIGPDANNCFQWRRQIFNSDLSHFTMHRQLGEKTSALSSFVPSAAVVAQALADDAAAAAAARALGNPPPHKTVPAGKAGSIHWKQHKPSLTIGTTWVLCATFDCSSGMAGIDNPVNTTYHIESPNSNVQVQRSPIFVHGHPVPVLIEGVMDIFVKAFIANASLPLNPDIILNRHLQPRGAQLVQLFAQGAAGKAAQQVAARAAAAAAHPVVLNFDFDENLKRELKLSLINHCINTTGLAGWPIYLPHNGLQNLNMRCVVIVPGNEREAPYEYFAWVTGYTANKISVQEANQAPNDILNPYQHTITVAQGQSVVDAVAVRTPTAAELMDPHLFPSFIPRVGPCMSRFHTVTAYQTPVIWYHAMITQVNQDSTVDVDIFNNTPDTVVVVAQKDLVRASVVVKQTVSIYAILPCSGSQNALTLRLDAARALAQAPARAAAAGPPAGQPAVKGKNKKG